MNGYAKFILLLGLFVLVGHAQRTTNPDSDFKSIHQLELGKQKNDSLGEIRETNEQITAESLSIQGTYVRTAINATLVIIVFLLLLVTIVFILFVRKKYRTSDE